MARNKKTRIDIAAEKKAKRGPYKREAKPRFDKTRNEWILSKTYHINNSKNPTRKHFYGKTAEECITKKNQFEYDLEHSISNCIANMTIPDLFQERNNVLLAKGKIKQSTYSRNMDTKKAIEKSAIGNIPIRKLTADDISTYLVKLSKKSQSLISKEYGAIIQAFNLAVEKEIIDKSPITKNSIYLTKPKSKKKKKEVRSFNIDEYKVFIKALYDYKPKKNCFNLIPQLKIAVMTGMRIGEINALTVNDIDIENNEIHIWRTITIDKNKQPILGETPKTVKSSVRTIIVSDEVINILKDSIKTMHKNKDNLIFYNWKSCRPFSSKDIGDFFRNFCKKNNLNCYGTHMLRHTYATMAINNGVDTFVLKELLGHESLNITISTYSEALKDNVKSNVSKHDDFVLKILNEIN